MTHSCFSMYYTADSSLTPIDLADTLTSDSEFNTGEWDRD